MKAKINNAGTQEKACLGIFESAPSLILMLALVGCGTTSNFKPTAVESAMELSRFNKVVVEDFADEASQKAPPARREKKQKEMKRVIQDFADMLVWETGHRCVFEQVSR